MYILTTRDKLLASLGLILVAGFLGVNFANLQVSSDSVRETLIKNELPLTSNNIYSEIQASLLRPIYISSLMANDTFLKDWMLSGEGDPAPVTKYLKEIQRKYDVFSTFVVSDLTKNYYHFAGILKQVSPEAEKDRWFFTMKDHPGNYRVDIDRNEAANWRLTIFVNHKIYDYDGKFMGVTGLGLDAVAVSELIQHYKERYDRDIYFVDREGMIKSHENDRFIDRMSIRDQPGIAVVADQVLSGERGSLTYSRNGDKVYLRFRYIPELDWYLLVEQPEQEALAELRGAFYLNLGISMAITLLVLVISGYTVNRFQRRLEQMARTDKLTGLFNREFFEALFEQAVNATTRHEEPLSLVLFDIDEFKDVNDRYGHLVGDRVIRDLALVARTKLRKTDVISRWGGDEFIILLSDCNRRDAWRIGDQLRRDIRERVRVPGTERPVTISVGVATYRKHEDMERLLERADAQLYRAKQGGRDRVEPAEASESWTRKSVITLYP
ncbi:MAG: diguanylate cyclase [Chromatiales bacterium]